jgi:O-antigen/teichoic acid export membrane protein
MSVARKILENTFAQILGRVLVAALSMVVLKIISRYLGASGYGDYTAIFQFLAFFGIIADFGIYTISVKEMSRDSTKIPMILGNVLGLRTILAAFAMALSVVVAFMIPTYRGTLIPMGILIAALATFITILNGTICSVLQAHMKMHYATISMVLGKVAMVLYLVWVAFFAFPHDPKMGFYQLMWSTVIGIFVNYVITAYYVRRFTPITIRFDFGYWKKIFLTSLPFGIALILNTLYFRVDVLVMTFLLPHSQLVVGKAVCGHLFCSDTEIGLFGIAMRVLELLLTLPLFFMSSSLPVMTRYIEEKSDKIRSLMQYSFDFLVAFSLPLLVGGVILARPLIEFISDRQYLSGVVFVYGSDLAIQILLFAMLFSFLNSLFGYTLVAMNKQVLLMWANGGAMILNLVGNLVLVPTYGFRGAAVVSVASEALILVVLYLISQKSLGFHLSPKILGQSLFASAMMGIPIYAGYQLMAGSRPLVQISVLIPLGILIYGYFIFKSKAVTPEMLALLRKQEPVGEEAPLPSGQNN